MKVLVACEFSGVVRDAFRALGHDAVSCDLLVSERPGPHIQGDVLDVMHQGWDLLIGHPPCTYLANSGVRWLHEQPRRWDHMRQAADFFRRLWEAPIERIALENPVMHRYGRSLVGGGPTQIIHPWQHGHPETKATGLWLRNLPPLTPTHDVHHTMTHLPDRIRHRVHHTPPGPNRWRERARTFTGIATAMATQWTNPTQPTLPLEGIAL